MNVNRDHANLRFCRWSLLPDPTILAKDSFGPKYKGGVARPFAHLQVFRSAVSAGRNEICLGQT
jgi:hypothetical protein